MCPQLPCLQMPYYLGQLPQLRILNLGGNGMTGDLSKFNFPTSSQVVYFNVSGNSLAGTLPQSLQNLLVFSFVPPPTCTDASTDPAAPPVGSAFAVGGTNLNIEFPLWLLDALGNLYNLTQGSIACINVRRTKGGGLWMAAVWYMGSLQSGRPSPPTLLSLLYLSQIPD